MFFFSNIYGNVLFLIVHFNMCIISYNYKYITQVNANISHGENNIRLGEKSPMYK